MIFFHYSPAGGWCCCWAKVCQGLTTLSQFLPGLKFSGQISQRGFEDERYTVCVSTGCLFLGMFPFFWELFWGVESLTFGHPIFHNWGWDPSDLWISGVLDGYLVRFSLNMFYKQICINLLHLAILFLILERSWTYFLVFLNDPWLKVPTFLGTPIYLSLL